MTLKKFNFSVIQKDNYSRCGLIKTHRGNIQTPTFMPVGTQATVKAAFIDDIIKVFPEYKEREFQGNLTSVVLTLPEGNEETVMPWLQKQGRKIYSALYQ